MKVPKTLPKWFPLLTQVLIDQESQCNNPCEKKVRFYREMKVEVENMWSDFATKYSDPPKPRKEKDPTDNVVKALSNLSEKTLGAEQEEIDKMTDAVKEGVSKLPPSLMKGIIEQYKEDNNITEPLVYEVYERPTKKLKKQQKEEEEEKTITTIIDKETLLDAKEQIDIHYRNINKEIPTLGLDIDHPLIQSIRGIYEIATTIVN